MYVYSYISLNIILHYSIVVIINVLLVTRPVIMSIWPRLSICTLIRFVWVSAKFGTCTVESVNGTFVEDKMRRFKGECAHFIFNKFPIYTHDSASAKCSTNSQKTDNSVYFVQYMVPFLQ